MHLMMNLFLLLIPLQSGRVQFPVESCLGVWEITSSKVDYKGKMFEHLENREEHLKYVVIGRESIVHVPKDQAHSVFESHYQSFKIASKLIRFQTDRPENRGGGTSTVKHVLTLQTKDKMEMRLEFKAPKGLSLAKEYRLSKLDESATKNILAELPKRRRNSVVYQP